MHATGLLSRLARCRRGGVLVEFAMLAPILVLLLLGGAEAARFFLIQQKLQRTAMTLADLGSRAPELAPQDVTNILAAAVEVARPYPMAMRGRVVLSSLGENAGGAPTVLWQVADGPLTAISRIGTAGGAADFSPPELLANQETVIAAEVFFAFEPLFIDLFPARTIYHRAVFRPRLSRAVALVGG